MFETFRKELSEHSTAGYHRLYGVSQREATLSWFTQKGLLPPSTYVDFLAEIGAGSFFDGALSIYPITGNANKTVETETQRLASVSKDPLIGIGYDGTTESCYCFDGKTGSDCMYWFSWEEKIKRAEASNFEMWIESKPSQLFRPEIYAGYSKIKNIDRVVEVMDERAAFKVTLKQHDKQLQRSPEKLNAVLPRFNRLVIRFEKTRSVRIKFITIMVRRIGSSIGQDNLEYVSIPVDDIPLGKVIERECYVFDPFNLPFERIEIEHNPIIDLGSKMRVRFKELSGLL